jgi:transposase
MKIIGADACKDRLVYCALNTNNLPADINDFYRDGDNFHTAHTNAVGLKEILDLKPDVIAIEPTGMNYTRLWVNHLGNAGVKIALIGHSQLHSYRKNLGLPDKDDPADALALGHYYANHKNSPRKFVLLRDETTALLREKALQLGHMARLQSPMINRLQQYLAYAFPEQAGKTTNAPLFWRWLAGEANSKKYDQLLAESIGSGITRAMQVEARLLSQVLEEERTIEHELSIVLQDPQFRPYRAVMTRYGMGLRTQAMIISQIYPISNFLSDDGQPIIQVTKGKQSGKPTAKHLSLRRFSKMLGTAPERAQSGSSPTATNRAGSQLCRNALWLWHFTRIESGRNRLRGDIGDVLYARFTGLKATNSQIKLVRSKAIAKAVVTLFYDLVDEVNGTAV